MPRELVWEWAAVLGWNKGAIGRLHVEVGISCSRYHFSAKGMHPNESRSKIRHSTPLSWPEDSELALSVARFFGLHESTRPETRVLPLDSGWETREATQALSRFDSPSFADSQWIRPLIKITNPPNKSKETHQRALWVSLVPEAGRASAPLCFRYVLAHLGISHRERTKVTASPTLGMSCLISMWPRS